MCPREPDAELQHGRDVTHSTRREVDAAHPVRELHAVGEEDPARPVRTSSRRRSCDQRPAASGQRPATSGAPPLLPLHPP